MDQYNRPDDDEFTAEQLAIVDELIAEQTDTAREQGKQLASVIKHLRHSTYRTESVKIAYGEHDACGNNGIIGDA